MKVTVGKLVGGQPRFFAGRFATKANPIGVYPPITTGRPDHARAYDCKVTAQLLADMFNAFEGIEAGTVSRAWIVVELPEVWQ
ncbi:hypothetical protein X566_15515 [Afipia sp. P52-10]|uniref:hypothetical protein n=1 Tax=Afipia sp. P52-10 TaxID=1429916 RepID=UPI0003DF1676|nr:hypothetical protein [Afipia sp. P52-10]ETR79172.1 hypothetical protein X566_15515 [Afipia sp. P52-10]